MGGYTAIAIYCWSSLDPSVYGAIETVETFGDTNVERKCGTYDVTLTSLNGACPISTFEHVKLTSYRAFTLYVRVTKVPSNNVCCGMVAREMLKT